MNLENPLSVFKLKQKQLLCYLNFGLIFTPNYKIQEAYFM